MINYDLGIASTNLYLELQVPGGKPIGYMAFAFYRATDANKILLRFKASVTDMRCVEVLFDRQMLAAAIVEPVEDVANNMAAKPGLFTMEYDHRCHRAVKITFTEPAPGERVQFQFPESGRLTFVVRVSSLSAIIQDSYRLVPLGSSTLWLNS